MSTKRNENAHGPLPETLFGRTLADYSGFRFSKLNDPRFSHLKLIAGWIVYFTLYFLTENLIPESSCHVVRCALDDLIPFQEFFVIFCCSWFVLIFGYLLFYLLYDTRRFAQLQSFIMITQFVAMAVYIFWPSVQLLRPEVFPRNNFFTWILSIIYAFDTPTGVTPSLHVAYSLGVVSVCLKDGRASRWWKAFVVVLVVIISLSTAFIKQHSVVDILAALPLGLLAEIIVFGKSWYLPRFRGRQEGKADR